MRLTVPENGGAKHPLQKNQKQGPVRFPDQAKGCLASRGGASRCGSNWRGHDAFRLDASRTCARSSDGSTRSAIGAGVARCNRRSRWRTSAGVSTASAFPIPTTMYRTTLTCIDLFSSHPSFIMSSMDICTMDICHTLHLSILQYPI
jgi:hypothetical protein